MLKRLSLAAVILCLSGITAVAGSKTMKCGNTLLRLQTSWFSSPTLEVRSKGKWENYCESPEFFENTVTCKTEKEHWVDAGESRIRMVRTLSDFVYVYDFQFLTKEDYRLNTLGNQTNSKVECSPV
jgi:hypothetical protein